MVLALALATEDFASPGCAEDSGCGWRQRLQETSRPVATSGSAISKAGAVHVPRCPPCAGCVLPREWETPKPKYLLAQCLGLGKGVRRDAAQAKLWLERAALQGHALAQQALKGQRETALRLA